MKETQIGDVAESDFTARCVRMGYIVCEPRNSNTVYDLILDSGTRLYKVQIKCTSKITTDSRYRINLQKGRTTKTTYSSDDVDLFAIYVMQDDDWYLIPFSAVEGRHNLRPRRNGKWEMYREKFSLL